MADTSDLWWKNAVIYCVDVETFQDSDGDGIGDFAGLTSRIDYLAELGITCLWLMPFYPTPDRDDGYDVTDLFGVDRRLGTHGDLVELIRTAARPRHPGHRRPRRQPHLGPAPVVQGGPAQHDQPLPRLLRLARRPAAGHLRPGRLPRPGGQHLEPRTTRTGEWYLHHFYSHQPDLNFANPAVRDEIAKSIGLLAPARAGRLPRRRRAVPGRGRRDRTATTSPATRTRTSRTCAPSWAAAAATRSCWARSTCRDRSSGATSVAAPATSCT